jgi:hypothetical protein
VLEKAQAKAARSTAAVVDLLVLLVLSFPAIRPLLAPGYLDADDAMFHLFRTIELDWLLRAGVLYPRLATDLSVGYDYPVFNFYPPLSAYAVEIFRLIGIGPIETLKLVLGLSIVGAAWGMRLFLDDLLPRSGALLGAIGFVYVPYFMMDVYDRAALAEVVAMASLPVVFWSIRRVARQPAGSTTLMAGLCLAFLLLAHNITALLAAPVLFAYWLFSATSKIGRREWHRAPGRRVVLAGSAAAALALALSAVYVAPSLGTLGLINGARATGGWFNFHSHLQPTYQMLAPEILYNYDVPLILRARLGVVQLGFIVAGLLIALGFGSWRRREGLFWAAALVALVFMTAQPSTIVWEHVPLLPYAQFPWRILGLIGMASGVLIGYVGTGIERGAGRIARQLSARVPIPLSLRAETATLTATGLVAASTFLIVVATTGFDRQPVAIDDIEARPWAAEQLEASLNEIASTTGEYIPPWADPRAFPRPADHDAPVTSHFAVTASGPFSVNLTVEASQPTPVTLDRIYFPGWQALVDGQPVTPHYSGAQGLLTVDVPAGQHRVQIWFGQTTLRAVATAVAGIGVILTLGLAGIAYRRRAKQPRAPHGAATVPVLLAVPSVAGLLALLMAGVGVLGDGILPTPSTPSLPATASFAEKIGLAGVSAARTDGDRVDLTVFWQGLGKLDHDYATTLRLVDATGKTIGDHVERPTFGAHQSVFWSANELVRDDEEIALPPGLPAGTYDLYVGVRDLTANAPLKPTPAVEAATSDVAVGKITLPARAPSRIAPLPNPSSASFGGMAALRSYQVERLAPTDFHVIAPTPGSALPPLNPGDYVRIDLRWQGERDILDNYSVFTHLVDRHGRVVTQLDQWPGQRMAPTVLWVPGDVIPDSYVLQVPDDAPPGEYDVTVGMYHLPDLQRLPLDNGPAGADQLTLATYKVLPKAPVTIDRLPQANRHAAKLGDVVELIGHDLAGGSANPTDNSALFQPGDQLGVTIYWQATGQTQNDYTVFVQVLDPSGKLVAQNDSQPLSGAEPTSVWDSGEIIADTHTLALPAGLAPGRYRVIAGMYLLSTGKRLTLATGEDYVPLQDIQIGGS